MHALHTIWIARNGIYFNNARVSAHPAKATIISHVSMSGSESKGYCFSSLSDTRILDALQVHPRHCRVKDIIPVVWQPPWRLPQMGQSWGTMPLTMVFSVITMVLLLAVFLVILDLFRFLNISCFDLFMPWKLLIINVGWNYGFRGDLKSVVLVFQNHDLVSWRLRNHWANCVYYGIRLLSYHVFREGNTSADKLANHGHTIQGMLWWDSLPTLIRDDFFRDRYGLPNDRFP